MDGICKIFVFPYSRCIIAPRGLKGVAVIASQCAGQGVVVPGLLNDQFQCHILRPLEAKEAGHPVLC